VSRDSADRTSSGYSAEMHGVVCLTLGAFATIAYTLLLDNGFSKYICMIPIVAAYGLSKLLVKLVRSPAPSAPAPPST
jgi:hypothetical protein